ncbi:MAG TPA: HAD-IIB family hydrolase [Modicisalibacter sp.]|nr:HAD-IIB family hydrolase [Modicisalibacter sp.]
MSRFADADPKLLSQVDTVLTDVDDTLTRHGKLSPSTLGAMARLMDAGIRVIPVTGGCAGWCDHIVRAWLVTAIIGESGAFRFRMSPGGGLEQRFVRPLAELREEQRQLLGIAARALQQVPAAKLAADQPYRLADVAVDHSQDVDPLAGEQVAAVIEVFRGAGARARASSIHVNAWFGDHDKATMATRLLSEDLELSASAQARRVLFIGDAPNDESLFRAYPLSVGVANIKPHLETLAHGPRWLCDASHGEGFTEMANRLLTVRQEMALP